MQKSKPATFAVHFSNQMQKGQGQMQKVKPMCNDHVKRSNEVSR